MTVLFKHILALQIDNFSSWRYYWGEGGGGAKRYVCPPPPQYFHWGGGGSCPPLPPRIDASDCVYKTNGKLSTTCPRDCRPLVLVAGFEKLLHVLPCPRRIFFSPTFRFIHIFFFFTTKVTWHEGSFLFFSFECHYVSEICYTFTDAASARGTWTYNGGWQGRQLPPPPMILALFFFGLSAQSRTMMIIPLPHSDYFATKKKKKK